MFLQTGLIYKHFEPYTLYEKNWLYKHKITAEQKILRKILKLL